MKKNSLFLKFHSLNLFIPSSRYYYALNSGKENEHYLQNRIISRGGRSSIYSSLFFRAESLSSKENAKFYGKIENFVKDEFKFDPENLLILSGSFLFSNWKKKKTKITHRWNLWKRLWFICSTFANSTSCKSDHNGWFIPKAENIFQEFAF